MPSLNPCPGAAFTTASRYFALLSVACCLSVGLRAEDAVDSTPGLENIPATSHGLASEAGAPQRLLAQASVEPDAGADWEAALPPTDRFDWLQTTSGEWLKGELKALYSGSIEFDSKEFKLRTLKMDDVARYLGHGIKRISIQTPTGHRTVDGLITIDRQRVIVVSDNGSRSFDRSLLISITPGAATEADNWSGKISFGFNYARGNTDQTDKIGSLLIRRRTPENRHRDRQQPPPEPALRYLP